MSNNCFIENPEKYADNLAKVKFRCKCGHKVIIPYWVDKQLCSYCHRWVYRDPKIEFVENFKAAKRKLEKRSK